ncbi:MAG: hypothetical protein II990_06390 [Muribaculaceae bacterium]|nr:hypothetical protein [Muribaculaceae bacterium]
MNKFKQWLSRLSFRTGIILIIACVICYILSFAQILLPISVTAKGVLWAVFFGLAKTFQYSALLVLGAEGVKRVKSWWKNKKIEKK